MIDDGVPICQTTEAPTLSPTVSIDRFLEATDAPTVDETALVRNESASEFEESNNTSTRGLLSFLFKASEHNVKVGSDESVGSRMLLSVSQEEYEMLKNFNSLSASDKMNIEEKIFLKSMIPDEVSSQEEDLETPERLDP